MSKILCIRTQSEKRFSLNGPPLELLEVAGYLKAHNHEVALLDLTVEKKEITKELLEGIDFVLVAYYSLNRVSAKKIIEKIKKVDPAKIVIAGTVFNNDSHTTTMWEHTMQNVLGIDVCLIGEPEETMLEIANKKDIAQIDGIAYRKDGKVVKNKERAAEENLDKFGFPAWDLVDFSKYKSSVCGVYNGVDVSERVSVPLRFSRGCPGACKYCALWWVWKKWRTKSGEHMFREVHDLHKKYGMDNFDFRDDCFGVNKKEVEIFCDKIIESGIKIAFSVSSRVDVLRDEHILRKLKQAGCYRTFYGIETGSQRILDEFNKQVDLPLMIETIKLVKKVGFDVHALLIVGSQKETAETVNETIDFLNEVQPDSVSFAGGIMLVPGTVYYSQAKKAGYINDDFWLTKDSHKIDNSNVSKFRVFLFTKAIRLRRKIVDMDKECSFFNYTEYAFIKFMHFLGLRSVTQFLATQLNRLGVKL